MKTNFILLVSIFSFLLPITGCTPNKYSSGEINNNSNNTQDENLDFGTIRAVTNCFQVDNVPTLNSQKRNSDLRDFLFQYKGQEFCVGESMARG